MYLCPRIVDCGIQSRTKNENTNNYILNSIIMKKSLLMKTMLLLCALVVGNASAWAADSWEETALSNLTSSDVFVIVGNNYAMTNNNGASSAPATASVTIINGKISGTVADNLKWNVTGNATDGYTFYPNGSTTTWLYCSTTAASGSNNNMRVGTGARKVFELDNNKIVTKDDKKARYLSIYNNADWRGYINTNLAPDIKFYKRVDAVVSFTITTTVNDANMGSVALEGTTITATPNSGYRVKDGDAGYSVTSGTATVVNNGDNTFTVDASSDCTVQINFEAIPTYQVTFSINGETSNQYYAEGANIVFPNPADIYGKKFVGWVTSTIDGTTSIAPQLIHSATMANTHQTYYAVFAKLSTDAQEFTINTGTSGIPTSYADAAYYTLNGTTVFNIHQMYYNSSYNRIQFKSSAGQIYNNTPLKNIQSIVVTYTSDDTQKNLALKVGTTENPTDGTSIEPTNSDLVYTFNTSGGNYDYFYLVNGTNAGYVTSIVINCYEYDKYCTTVTNLLDPDLAYDVTSYKLAPNVNLTPVLTNPHGLTVSYASSDEDIAYVDDATGEILTGSKIGTATITATFVGNATYAAGNAAYTITTYNPTANDGSEAKPYTVTEALALIDALPSNGTIANVYAKGKVSQVKSWNSVAHHLTYYIEDFDDNTKELYIYRGFNFGNTEFPSMDALSVGDEVVVFGTLQKYVQSGSATAEPVPEFAANNYIVQYKATGSTTETKSLQVAAARYRTYVASANLIVPDGVKAYIATGETASTLTLTSVDKIKEGTPVILNAEEGHYSFVIIDETVTYPAENLLKISDGTIVNGVYVLAKKNSTVAFYKWAGGALSPGKVYVEAPSGGAHEYLEFSFEDDATAIETVKAQNVENGQFFNLAGQRVAQPTKGLYIVNGKKVIIK